MTRLRRFSVRLDGALSPQDCRRLAQIAEANGFDGLWFAENPFARGIVSSAAACALETKRLRIGSGVVNPFSRHPSLIAMEWGALDELTAGRAVLGLGGGIPGAMRRIGFLWDRPLSAVREAIHIIRDLLRGGVVSYRGRVFSVDRVRLDFCPVRPDLPIFMAAVGDRALKLCGEIADGLIVSNMLPAGYSAHAAAVLGAAARAHDRAMPEIVQYVPCVVRADRDEAQHLVKPPLGRMLRAFWALGEEWPARRDAMVGTSGISAAEFAAAMARLQRGEAVERVLDDRFVDAFAVAGTAADCLARAEIYRQSGVDELALNFVGGDPARDIEYLGASLTGGRQHDPSNE